MKKKLVKRVGWALLTLGILFSPFWVTVSPARHLEVFSDSGKPIAQAKIQRIWHFYSIGERGQNEFYSDQLGKVVLPEERKRVNLFCLIYGSVKNFLELGINASYGRHESVGVFATGYSTKWFHDQLDNKNTTTVLEKALPENVE